MGAPRLVTINGKTNTLSGWARKVNIDPTTVHTRLKNGWPLEKALTTPSQIRSQTDQQLSVWYENGKRHTTPEYRSWQMMRNRCNNPNTADYSYYGARGITVCPRWDIFENFLFDLGPKPDLTYTLERADVNKGYTPCNCYWATRKTQARNRNYVKLSLKKAHEIRRLYKEGVKQVPLAKQFGVNQQTISLIVRNEAWV